MSEGWFSNMSTRDKIIYFTRFQWRMKETLDGRTLLTMSILALTVVGSLTKRISIEHRAKQTQKCREQGKQINQSLNQGLEGCRREDWEGQWGTWLVLWSFYSTGTEESWDLSEKGSSLFWKTLESTGKFWKEQSNSWQPETAGP